MSDIAELVYFFENGKAGDVQECKTSWFETLVKSPLKNAICGLIGKYPEVDGSKITKHNAIAWIALKEDYLSHETNPVIAKMATAFFDLIINSHEHDPPYEERIDTLGEMIADAYQSGKFIRRDHPPLRNWKIE